MKRIFLLSLLGVLALGSARTALAASQVDFTGFYRAYYFSENNYTRNGYGASFGPDAGKFSDSDSYFQSRLEINVTFKPTDEISVVWRLRGPNRQRWGTWTYSGQNNETDFGPTLTTRYVYGQIVQDWGTLRIGKMFKPARAGLMSLGYFPTSADGAWTQIAPFDNNVDRDGVYYAKDWDNGFGLTANFFRYGSKLVDNEQLVNDADNNNDRYMIEPRYKWDGGGAALGLEYYRDYAYAVNKADGAQWGDPVKNPPTAVTKGFDSRSWGNRQSWFINPSIMHSWGDFSVHAEGKMGWGRTYGQNWDDTLRNDGKGDKNEKYKAEGYGFYLDAVYNYGPGNVTVGGWWTDGNKLSDSYDKDNALVDMGGDFYPLVVAYNAGAFGFGRQTTNVTSAGTAVFYANNANNFFDPTLKGYGNLSAPAQLALRGDYDDSIARGRAMGQNRNGIANHWGAMVFGDHSFNDDISMHYAAAYLGLVNSNYLAPDYYNAAADKWSYKSQSKDLGVELDLGFKFQLLEKLAFTSTFGYMFNGDAYQRLVSYSQDGNGNFKANWQDPGDTCTWANTLTFSF